MSLAAPLYPFCHEISPTQRKHRLNPPHATLTHSRALNTYTYRVPNSLGECCSLRQAYQFDHACPLASRFSSSVCVCVWAKCRKLKYGFRFSVYMQPSITKPNPHICILGSAVCWCLPLCLHLYYFIIVSFTFQISSRLPKSE